MSRIDSEFIERCLSSSSDLGRARRILDQFIAFEFDDNLEAKAFQDYIAAESDCNLTIADGIRLYGPGQFTTQTFTLQLEGLIASGSNDPGLKAVLKDLSQWRNHPSTYALCVKRWWISTCEAAKKSHAVVIQYFPSITLGYWIYLTAWTGTGGIWVLAKAKSKDYSESGWNLVRSTKRFINASALIAVASNYVNKVYKSASSESIAISRVSRDIAAELRVVHSKV